MLSMFGMF
uniref:Uncharacterized protein n=1 Tax=Arundo donax TaxID=35708 RepID=A0A0A8ZQB3_ARUDO